MFSPIHEARIIDLHLVVNLFYETTGREFVITYKIKWVLQKDTTAGPPIGNLFAHLHAM
jgi:hypothetical protein